MEHGYKGWSLHFAGERDWQIATKFSLSLSCDRDYAGESFRDLCSFEITKHGFFGHFKDFLPRVNQALFTTAMEDDSMAAMIASWQDHVIEFVTAKLEKYQPRDNYRDLLELSIYIPGWRSCMWNLLPISWSHSPCSLDDHGHIFH